jgi:hypothetical protein
MLIEPLPARPPLYCDPFYANKLWARDWVAGRGQYDPTRIKIPVEQAPSATLGGYEDYQVITLIRHKCAGMAPYVGEPFMYVWYMGIDDYGRSICSDSEIVYTNPFGGF